MTNALVLALVVWAWAGAALAQDRPAYSNLRYDEDWRAMGDTTQASDKWDPVKHIALGGEAYLSLGGDARVRYEYFRNPGFGAGRQDANGYGLQRYMLHGDLRINSWWRVFGQLQHSQESGRLGGPRRFDENKLDVHQAFVDIGRWQTMRHYTALRLGRQELEFPFARLMSVRDGRNTRITFQGGRFIHQRPDWRGALWALRPVRIDRNEFDDEWDETRLAAGAAYTRYGFLTPKGNIAITYHLFNERFARYEQGAAPEHRHGLGARLWGVVGGFDYNYEAVYQFGNFGDAAIRAWDLLTDTGYAWNEVRFQPRLGMRFDVTSGDGNLNDNRLGNFNPLFAATAYSGLAGLRPLRRPTVDVASKLAADQPRKLGCNAIVLRHRPLLARNRRRKKRGLFHRLVELSHLKWHGCEPRRMRLLDDAMPATALGKARGSIDNRTPGLPKSPRDNYSNNTKNSLRLYLLR